MNIQETPIDGSPDGYEPEANDAWLEETDELPPRPRRKLLAPVPIALFVVLLLALAFFAGVEVQKSQGGSSASGVPSGFAALRSAARAGSSGGASTGGASPFAGGAASGGGFPGWAAWAVASRQVKSPTWTARRSTSPPGKGPLSRSAARRAPKSARRSRQASRASTRATRSSSGGARPRTAASPQARSA